MSAGPKERVSIILAAGQGKRMKSDLPKVLHPIGERPMIQRVIETAVQAGFPRHVIVVGHGREQVKDALRGYPVEFAVQEELLGTGHAVEMAASRLEHFRGEVVVLCGDVPLLSVETLRALVDVHERGGYAATVLTFAPDDATGYGRIYRDASGDVLRIVEQRDLPPNEAHPNESNSGTFCFNWALLRPVLRELRTDNDQGEYYLTDTVALLRDAGHRVGAYLTRDAIEVSGINDPEQLQALDAEFRRRQAGRTS